MATDLDATIRRLEDVPVFFVGGLPRSGTTWVQQMLNAHPQVLCVGESHFFNDLMAGIGRAVLDYTSRRASGVGTWAPSAVGPDRARMLPVVRTAFASLASANLGDHDVERLVVIGEKTPDNVYQLHRIWAVFPQAKFIHVIRDVRDACVSAYIRFRAKLPADMDRPTYIGFYARDWMSRITSAREQAEGQDYLELRYEDLQLDTEAQMVRVFGFLGADVGSGVVADAVRVASFEALSGGRRRGEEDRQSHYRRGEVGGWRDELTVEEVALFEDIAGPMMRTLGYQTETAA
ncbi:MAG: sulfotransferase [Alphaproteobacteria bacterium]|nr:sulfotransferase [Alphaproteobacteria bacterium]